MGIYELLQHLKQHLDIHVIWEGISYETLSWNAKMKSFWFYCSIDETYDGEPVSMREAVRMLRSNSDVYVVMRPQDYD